MEMVLAVEMAMFYHELPVDSQMRVSNTILETQIHSRKAKTYYQHSQIWL